LSLKRFPSPLPTVAYTVQGGVDLFSFCPAEIIAFWGNRVPSMRALRPSPPKTISFLHHLVLVPTHFCKGRFPLRIYHLLFIWAEPTVTKDPHHSNFLALYIPPNLSRLLFCTQQLHPLGTAYFFFNGLDPLEPFDHGQMAFKEECVFLASPFYAHFLTNLLAIRNLRNTLALNSPSTHPHGTVFFLLISGPARFAWFTSCVYFFPPFSLASDVKRSMPFPPERFSFSSPYCRGRVFMPSLPLPPPSPFARSIPGLTPPKWPQLGNLASTLFRLFFPYPFTTLSGMTQSAAPNLFSHRFHFFFPVPPHPVSSSQCKAPPPYDLLFFSRAARYHRAEAYVPWGLTSCCTSCYLFLGFFG